MCIYKSIELPTSHEEANNLLKGEHTHNITDDFVLVDNDADGRVIRLCVRNDLVSNSDVPDLFWDIATITVGAITFRLPRQWIGEAVCLISALCPEQCFAYVDEDARKPMLEFARRQNGARWKMSRVVLVVDRGVTIPFKGKTSKE